MNKLRNKLTTALVAVTLMAPAFGLMAYASKDQTLYTFETGLAPFKPAAFHRSDLTAKTLTILYEKKFTGNSAAPGPFNAFAGLNAETGAPVWMQADFPADLEGDGNTLAVEFQARDVANCGGCITLLYAGRHQPQSLMDFATDFRSMDGTWEGHKYLIPLGNPNAGGVVQGKMIFLAIGFTNLDHKHGSRTSGTETPGQIMGVDNLSIKLQTVMPPPAPVNN